MICQSVTKKNKLGDVLRIAMEQSQHSINVNIVTHVLRMTVG